MESESSQSKRESKLVRYLTKFASLFPLVKFQPGMNLYADPKKIKTQYSLQTMAGFLILMVVFILYFTIFLVRLPQIGTEIASVYQYSNYTAGYINVEQRNFDTVFNKVI